MNLQLFAHHTKAHTLEMNALGLLVITAALLGLAATAYYYFSKRSNRD